MADNTNLNLKKKLDENEINIRNVVVSCDTHTKFALETLASELSEAEYSPESFPGLVYRVKEPKASNLIFSTGKIICSGTRSKEDAKKAIEIALQNFRDIGVDVSDRLDMEIVNIVASGNLKSHLELNTIVFKLSDCEYEPEQFPGVVHRIFDPKVVFLIFSSGKIVITGARSIEQVVAGVEKLKEELRELGVMK
ncbi:MAG: TATA-box-binding protein [DPANN group archaeon]|nr:TATA-box-binding protein [DPANN group archaeon]